MNVEKGVTRVVDWDGEQYAFIRSELGGTKVLWGAPGTGKSAALLEKVGNAVEHQNIDPDSVLFLTPSRVSAGRARERISARLGRTMSVNPARTWSSYAFDLIQRAVAAGLIETGQRAPKLLSGAEQDVIIAELLAGHAKGEVAGPEWPEGLELAVRTRAFRQEVRELFDRLNEAGLDAADLAELGREHGIPEWVGAAQLFGEYLDTLDLRMPEAFDPAQVMRAAILVLRNNPEFLAAERERLRLVVVDDLQDATGAQLELLDELRGPGDQAAPAVVVAIAPDSTVQGFRGASAEAAIDVIERWRAAGSVQDVVLETSHRMSAEVAQGWSRVVERIGVRGGGRNSRVLDTSGTATEQQGVRADVAASVHHEHRLIGSRIMDAHLDEGVPFSSMAVIVRNSGMVEPLVRSLAQQGVPVQRASSSEVLASNRAAWAVLTVLKIARDAAVLTEEIAVELLGTPFGESDAVRLRRLRHQLTRAVAKSGREVSPEPGVLARALLGDIDIPNDAGADGVGARRIAAMIAAAREAHARGVDDIELTLWKVWEAAGVAATWQRLALGEDGHGDGGHSDGGLGDGGHSEALRAGNDAVANSRAARSAAARSANENLDAMIILFAAAERFNEQLAAANAGQFVEYVLGQEVPMDSLAGPDAAEDSVEVMTVAASAGRSWERVFISGVQAGVWPNTRIRGQVLRSADLADLVRTGVMQTDYSTQVKDVVYDELKTFAVALSRARTHVYVSAVDGDDAAVSPFVDLVDPQGQTDTPRERVVVPRTKNLRSLVAALRQEAEAGYAERPDTGADGNAGIRDAVETLTFLGQPEQGVEGAHPNSWWGLLPLSSHADIIADGQAVSVSPSRIQTAIDSPLNWFLSAAGGEVATDFARSLGTLVHEIAELLPAGTPPELSAKLEELWPRLNMPNNWLAAKDRERAERMVDKLGRYINEDLPASGRELVGTEVQFRADVSGTDRYAILSGIVDRLERDEQGRLVVIDFKTGRTKPSAEDVRELPQLAAYQVAVEESAFGDGSGNESGGAALVQLGTSEASLAVQTQGPLGAETWALELLHEAVDAMSGNSFAAHHEAGSGGQFGARCTVPWVCPLCEGLQVTE